MNPAILAHLELLAINARHLADALLNGKIAGRRLPHEDVARAVAEIARLAAQVKADASA